MANFHIVLDVCDLVFNLNPGPTGYAHITSIVSSRIESRAHPCREPARDTLISVERNAIFGNLENWAFQLCSLNARSLKNKSSDFVDLVCDLRAELFTLCESWLNDLDSAILSELTLPSYAKLYHCPVQIVGVAGLRYYIGTVLMQTKCFQPSDLRLKCRNGLWSSELFVCELSSCIDQHTLRIIP